jgi:ankyrin repeat protein
MAVLPAPQLSVASPTYLQILRSAAISLLEGKSANKADPNIPNLDGWTPLQLACQRLSLDGASQLVEDLIANGARPPQEKGGLTGELPTPLEFALAAGNRDLAQKLFNVGDRPFFTSWSKALTSEQLVSFTAPELAQRDRFGLTLLHVAALLDKPALVESILSYAALPSYVKAITLGSETPFQATDPDWLGQSALTYALRARTGHIEEAPEVVQALLSARLLPTRADVALVIANSDARVAHLLRDLVLPPSGTPSRHPRGYPLFDSLADRARFAELASPAV